MTDTTTQILGERKDIAKQGVELALQAAIAQKAIEWAEEKVQYRHRGTTKRGCDCTGMLIGVARQLGYLRKYVLRMYPKDWNLHAAAGNYICEELEKVCNEIPNSQASNGDVLVFRFGKCLAHAGVVIDIKKRIFVHSFLTSGKCQYAILRNSIWSKRWERTYRFSIEKMEKYS